jgi:hypothetical protein
MSVARPFRTEENQHDQARTDFGRQLVKQRVLFQGETDARASWWVAQIENQAVGDYKAMIRGFRSNLGL